MKDAPVTAQHLVGREAEIGAIVRLLDAREGLSAAAVLTGEARIGKTTLWPAGIDAAADCWKGEERPAERRCAGTREPQPG